VKRVCALDMPVPAGLEARAMLPSTRRLEAAVRDVIR
jgi:hypothetical protein